MKKDRSDGHEDGEHEEPESLQYPPVRTIPQADVTGRPANVAAARHITGTHQRQLSSFFPLLSTTICSVVRASCWMFAGSGT